MTDEAPQLLVWDFGFADLACEIDVAKNSAQGLVIGIFKACQCLVQLIGYV